MMLISPEVWAALLDAGIVVRPLSPSEVELGTGDGAGGPAIVTVQRRSAPLSPSHVPQLVAGAPDRRLLVIVPSASPAAMAAASAAGVSVIALNSDTAHGPAGRLLLPHADVVIGSTRSTATAPETGQVRPGRQPWGTLTVARHVLSGGARTQQDMARRAGVSQPRVSQILSELEHAGLVRRRVDSSGGPRWSAVDWHALLQWWLAAYPGPGGITTHWYALSPPREQAEATVAALSRHAARIAVSGDVAADQIAPWRRPVRAVVYADLSVGADLAEAGLTPFGAEDATLELTVPADPGVWAEPDDAVADPAVPVADALQVLWDVRRSPGADTDQAVAALLPLLESRATAAAEQT